MDNNEAAAYKLQYWNGTVWVDIFETTNSHAYLKYPDAVPADWWYYWSTPYENTFTPVVSDKLRIWTYPRAGSHAWLYEVEVYNSVIRAIANAGNDLVVDEEALVTLDGSGSSCEPGKSLTYEWTIIAGPDVTLDLSDPAHPTFTAPVVQSNGKTLTFSLVVNDE